ncbi:MAG TPA: ester cyclase [Actinomycetota bacterium]
MSVEENKATVKRYFEGDHDGRDNTELWDELCTPDMTLIAAVFPEPVRGLEPLKQITKGMHAAMSGFAIAVEDMVGEDDRVAARWTMSGTHTGAFPLPDGTTMEGSGRSFSVSGMSFMRLEDGKLAEERTEADWMGMLRQLGAMPR